MNLTDGLDGLAIMPIVMVAGALGVFAYASSNAVYSNYLGIPYVPNTGELTIFVLLLLVPAWVFFGITVILPKFSWAMWALWR